MSHQDVPADPFNVTIACGRLDERQSQFTTYSHLELLNLPHLLHRCLLKTRENEQCKWARRAADLRGPHKES